MQKLIENSKVKGLKSPIINAISTRMLRWTNTRIFVPDTNSSIFVVTNEDKNVKKYNFCLILVST